MHSIKRTTRHVLNFCLLFYDLQDIPCHVDKPSSKLPAHVPYTSTLLVSRHITTLHIKPPTLAIFHFRNSHAHLPEVPIRSRQPRTRRPPSRAIYFPRTGSPKPASWSHPETLTKSNRLPLTPSRTFHECFKQYPPVETKKAQFFKGVASIPLRPVDVAMQEDPACGASVALATKPSAPTWGGHARNGHPWGSSSAKPQFVVLAPTSLIFWVGPREACLRGCQLVSS